MSIPIYEIWNEAECYTDITPVLLLHRIAESVSPPNLYILLITDQNKIFRIDFVSIHYHLGEISYQIIECNFFGPYELSITNYSMVRSSTFVYKQRRLTNHIFTQMYKKYIYTGVARLCVNYAHTTLKKIWLCYVKKFVEINLLLQI